MQGRNVNLDINRIVGYRQFANKLWNAIKFALYHFTKQSFKPDSQSTNRVIANQANRWLLSRLNAAILSVQSSMKAYELAEACIAVYSFFWYELCDVYIELAKPTLNGADAKVYMKNDRQTEW